MKPQNHRRRFRINVLFIVLFIVLITGGIIGLVIGGADAFAQTDEAAGTLGISDEADSTEEPESIEGIQTEEGALGLDPARVYDIPGEEYEDIEEDYEEEIIEEEEILDDYYEEEEGADEEIPLEEIDPDELESPIEEEEYEFESEFEEYDVEEMESPGEDHTIGTEFEEIDPGELESAPEGVTAQ